MIKARHMRTRSIVLAAGLLAASGAFAQDHAVAKLKSVTGNVLVSQEAGMASGNADQPLVNGTRIITTANSEAIVRYENGCEVRVKENERLEIDDKKPCAAILPQAMGGAAIAALGAAAPASAIAVAAGGVGVTAVAVEEEIRRRRRRPSVSPN
jgi:hypothetical protein